MCYGYPFCLSRHSSYRIMNVLYLIALIGLLGLIYSYGKHVYLFVVGFFFVLSIFSFKQIIKTNISHIWIEILIWNLGITPLSTCVWYVDVWIIFVIHGRAFEIVLGVFIFKVMRINIFFVKQCVCLSIIVIVPK